MKCYGRHAGELLSLLCDTLNLHQPPCDTVGFPGRRASKYLQQEQKDIDSGLERDSSHLREVVGNSEKLGKSGAVSDKRMTKKCRPVIILLEESLHVGSKIMFAPYKLLNLYVLPA